MDYTSSLIWLALWPLVIYAGYRFTKFNLKHFQKLEQFEE